MRALINSITVLFVLFLGIFQHEGAVLKLEKVCLKVSGGRLKIKMSNTADALQQYCKTQISTCSAPKVALNCEKLLKNKDYTHADFMNSLMKEMDFFISKTRDQDYPPPYIFTSETGRLDASPR